MNVITDLVQELNEREEAWLSEKANAEETNNGLDNEKALLELNIEAKTQELKDLQERLKALNEYMKTTNADEISAKEKMDDIARKIVYSIDYKKSMQETLEK